MNLTVSLLTDKVLCAYNCEILTADVDHNYELLYLHVIQHFVSTCICLCLQYNINSCFEN